MNKKVESFRITPDGRKQLKRIKAMAMIKSILEKKKKKVDMQSMILGKALDDTYKSILEATKTPGEEFTHNISMQEGLDG